MKIMIFWLDFCFYTCLLLTGPLLDFGNHLSEGTSEYSPCWWWSNMKKQKKELVRKRPPIDLITKNKKKGKDSEPKWAGTVSATFERWEHTDYRAAGEDNYRRL